jgi:hypothetical protein
VFALPEQAKAEPLTVAVQFTTVTGAKAAKDATIFFKPPAAAAKELYTIKGQVVWNALGQIGLEVLLKDAKGNVIDQKKTGDQGAFVFEKVESGTYVVSSREGFQNMSGEAKVEIPDKKDKDKKEFKVTVELGRKKK